MIPHWEQNLFLENAFRMHFEEKRGKAAYKMVRKKMKQEEKLMEVGSEKYSIRTCKPGHITLCYCTSHHYPNLLLNCWHLSSLCSKMV